MPPRPVPPPKKSGAGKWILVGILAFFVLCCGSGALLVAFGSKEVAKLEPLKDACVGGTVASAAAYRATPGNQRVVGFERGGGGSFVVDYDLVPSQWRGESAGDTALVLCAEEQTQEMLERCDYGGGLLRPGVRTLERWGYRRDVRLVEARTGRVLLATTLRGAPPTSCADRETFGRSSTERRYGSTIGAQQVEAVLAPHVLANPASSAGAPAGPVVPMPAPSAPTLPLGPAVPAPAPAPTP